MTVRRDRLAALVDRASTVVDRVAPPPPGMCVLIYHRVGATTGVGVDLATETFRAQMEHLSATGRVLALADALRPGAPADSIVITFDDGTADWATTAMPILAGLGLPVTFYVSTMFVDEQRMFPGSGIPITWSALEEIASTGLATFGSHTHSHRVLADADSHLAVQEIGRSTSLIEDRLGVTCTDFAYPKAIRGSSAAEVVVRRRFTTATLAGSRPNGAGADRHRLCRTPITVRDDTETFIRKAGGGTRLEGKLRDLRGGLVRVRSRSAGDA